MAIGPQSFVVQAGFIECGATALFLFFTIGTITSGDLKYQHMTCQMLLKCRVVDETHKDA